MQKAIELTHSGLTLRGMEHVPEANGVKLPAVILFHGFTGNKLEPHRLFWKISRKLEQMGIACFRFDFLGSGESDGDFEEMTVSREIAEANTILDFVKADPRIDENRISLLGLSLGGLIASVLAGDRASEIHKLILMAPAGTISGKYAQSLVDFPYIEGKGYDNAGNIIGKAFVEDVQRIDVFDRSAAYQNPVLLIHGTDDIAVPVDVSTTYNLESYGGRARLHIIENGNHTFDCYEWEQDVISTIVSFMKSS